MSDTGRSKEKQFFFLGHLSELSNMCRVNVIGVSDTRHA